MRIVVFGATGNAGTSLLDAFERDGSVDSVLGVARRPPAARGDGKTEWTRADVTVVPDVPRLRFQVVHSCDVGEAYRLAATGDARGAFNVAADPVVDPDVLARLLHACKVPVPERVLRGGAALSWKLRLQPSPPGWVDLALETPLLDSSRARNELGWSPRFTGLQALEDVLRGIRERAGADTPPLEPSESRVDEVVATRVGGED